MICENDPDHKGVHYCKHCGTCHECIEEHNDANELIISELKKLIEEATTRLSQPVNKIRQDGFRELMGKLRAVNQK